MVNKIWGYFIIIGIIYGVFSGNVIKINETILMSTKTSLDLLLQIFPVVALWLGIANIATQSGLLEKMSMGLTKILGPFFPEIPKNHISLSYIASNIIANLFGLGNAATPFGLKAMNSLQEINKDKTKASRSMITFTTINTSGVTIVPTTIIALRILYGSVNPTLTVISTLIATSLATVAGLIIDNFFARRNHE
jgi:Uncharacterized membrane protein, required for spore maturation in B.subtilis.